MAEKPLSMIGALVMVMQERSRQESHEGYTAAHDDEHDEGELAVLAAGYALTSMRQENHLLYPCPVAVNYLRGILEAFGWEFKPKDPIRDLVRAGALILAELERRLRRVKPMAAEVQLPRWKSHKEVWGDKIVEVRDVGPANREGPDDSGFRWVLACGAIISVSLHLHNRVSDVIDASLDPTGGYYVLYNDNYESWSPSEAFEEGYTRIE